MSDKTNAWDNLDIKTKAWVIKQAVQGGLSKDLDEIKQLYNEAYYLNNIAKQQNPNIIQKLNQDNLKTIDNWKNPKYKVSHKIGSYGSSPQHFMSTRKYDEGGPTDDVVYYGGNLPEVTVIGKKRDPLGLSWKDFVDAGGLSAAVALGETALDFTPVVGDIKGLTYDVYKGYEDDGWKGAGINFGLGLVGLVPLFGDYIKKVASQAWKMPKTLLNAASNKKVKGTIGTGETTTKKLENHTNPLTTNEYTLKNTDSQTLNDVLPDQMPYYGTTYLRPTSGEAEYMNNIRNFYDDIFNRAMVGRDPNFKLNNETLFDTPIEVYEFPKKSEISGYSSSRGKIYVNKANKVDANIVHEMNHQLQDLNLVNPNAQIISPEMYSLYSKDNIKLLSDAYGFTKPFKESNNLDDIGAFIEMATSNTEMRYIISKANGNVLGKELETVIDNLSPEQLFNVLRNTNGYTYNFLESMKKETGLNGLQAVKLKSNQIKNALKYVPAFTGAAGAAVGAQMIGNNEYKFGGPKEGDYFGEHLPEVEVAADLPKKTEVLGIDGSAWADVGLGMIPIVGTINEAYNLIQNPSWANAGWTAFSLLTDIPFLSWAKAFKAAKAAKALEVATEATRNYKKAKKTVDRMRAIPNINPRRISAASGKAGKLYRDMKISNKAYENLARQTFPTVGPEYKMFIAPLIGADIDYAKKLIDTTQKYSKYENDNTQYSTGGYFNTKNVKRYLENSGGNEKLRILDEGGPKGGEYNIFEDPESFEGRDQHRKSLDAFVKNNPKLYGLNTADFVDFLSQIAGLESGYRSGATTDASTYSGYYGLKNGHTFDVDTQHKKAFQHLASIFKENITKQDIDKAISLGITPSQLLAKYWNQGNRVTNYLYNGTDNTDALGTKISKYGWNVTAPVEYKHLVPEGITQDFVLVENAKSLADATKLARNQYIDYSNRDAYIKKVNVERYKNKKRNPKFIDTKLQVGDTIFLTPMNVPTINKK